MKFDTLTVKTGSAGAEALAGELLINQITSFSITDPRDFLSIVTEKAVPFDYYDESLLPQEKESAVLVLYTPKNKKGKAQKETAVAAVRKLQSQNTFGTFELSCDQVCDTDWEDGWKKYFHPFPVGEKLMIKPSWENCAPDGRIILEIDPASSFGSGSHETTRLCLELMEKEDLNGAAVLDMGCGSGILGIAACLLGAKMCVGVDTEQNAVEIARKNARINRIEDSRFTARCGNILQDGALFKAIGQTRYDVIVSNIVADVLADMAPLFKALLKNGGRVILSGIIASGEKRVFDALLENGFEITEIKRENDWSSIKARK